MNKIKLAIVLILALNGILACQNKPLKPSMKIMEIHLLSDNPEWHCRILYKHAWVAYMPGRDNLVIESK